MERHFWLQVRVGALAVPWSRNSRILVGKYSLSVEQKKRWTHYRIYPIVADVSDWNNLRETVQNLNVLDGVVNNAAYQLETGPVAAMDCPKERFEKAYSTNTLAAINIIQMAGKKMIETGKRGSIVNVSR